MFTELLPHIWHYSRKLGYRAEQGITFSCRKTDNEHINGFRQPLFQYRHWIMAEPDWVCGGRRREEFAVWLGVASGEVTW
jgi:hypothetical protein